MYYFIVNPASRSGYGYRIWKKIERRLESERLDYRAFLTERPGQASEFARELTGHCREPRTIVVVGGDGTMNEVVDGIDGCDFVTLGFIPAGTGSDLARSLKLPRSPLRCLRRILCPRQYRQMDYGVMTYGDDVLRHRRFVVSAGIGLDAAVCHQMLYSHIRTFFNRFHMRRLPYVLVGLAEFWMTKPVRGYILLDGIKRVEFNSIYFISAQIHPSEGGGFRFAPRADCSDGNLEVCILSHASRRQALSILTGAYFGRSRLRGMRVYSCREVQIHTERPLAVHADGESCQYQSDIELRCIERKLRIVT